MHFRGYVHWDIIFNMVLKVASLSDEGFWLTLLNWMEEGEFNVLRDAWLYLFTQKFEILNMFVVLTLNLVV